MSTVAAVCLALTGVVAWAPVARLTAIRHWILGTGGLLVLALTGAGAFQGEFTIVECTLVGAAGLVLSLPLYQTPDSVGLRRFAAAMAAVSGVGIWLVVVPGGFLASSPPWATLGSRLMFLLVSATLGVAVGLLVQILLSSLDGRPAIAVVMALLSIPVLTSFEAAVPVVVSIALAMGLLEGVRARSSSSQRRKPSQPDESLAASVALLLVGALVGLTSEVAPIGWAGILCMALAVALYSARSWDRHRRADPWFAAVVVVVISGYLHYLQ